MHRITRRTRVSGPLDPFCMESPMTGRNEPPVKSDTGDTARFSRSMDLGVNTISGLTGADSARQRSRWKYLAGVRGIATVMLSCAHSDRKPSIGDEECSGD